MIRLLVLTAALSACATSSHHAKHGEIEVFTFRENYNNVHLIVGNGQALLIDAGLPKDAAGIERRIRDAGVDPKTLSAIIVTHGHADHAGGALAFQQKYGTRVIAGKGDEGMLTTGKNDKLCPTSGQAESIQEESQNATYEPFKADILADAPINLADYGGISGTIFPVAGHTEGSLVVVSGPVAFVGDVFRGGIVGSGAEVHFFMCDLADNKADIRRLLDENPAVQHFYTGHFGPVDREAVEALLADFQPPFAP